MSVLQAAVLGLIQGLTEFLPVSSSAHLVVLPWILRWPDQGLAFDVALHWGTLAALAVYFRADLAALAKDGLKGPRAPEGRLAWGIALGTVPAVLAGALLDDKIEALFRRPDRIAWPLMAFGVLLWAADRSGGKDKGVRDISWGACLAIGCAQAMAIVPGVSRSGATITAGLLLGLRREEAARFSFLLSAPIVLAAGLFKAKDLAPAALAGAPFWIGLLAAAASGWLAIGVLLRYVKTKDMGVFAVYRVALGLLILLLYDAQPGQERAKILAAQGVPPMESSKKLSPEAERLRRKVQALAGGIGQRSAVLDPKALARARDWVAGELKACGLTPKLLEYRSQGLGGLKDGAVFHNVEAVLPGSHGPGEGGILVLGAHYDTVDTPGADDDASGVAVLLDLACRLMGKPLAREVRLVFFSTEEPPSFGTRNMGSRHYAQALKAQGVEVYGMVSLEMLGYYDARPGSQLYPPFLKWFFPKQGDFIGLVSDWRSRGFMRRVRDLWRKDSSFPLVAAALPGIPAISLSDHVNFWEAGFPALMLTDTAFYRNPHYHEPTDRPETLDYERMAQVAAALEAVVPRL